MAWARKRFVKPSADSLVYSEKRHEPASEIFSVQGSSSAVHHTEQQLKYLGNRQLASGKYRLPQIWQAASQGANSAVARLLSENSDFNIDSVDAENEYGTILAAAARGGHDSLTKILLASGASLEARGGRYYSALQSAAHSGSSATVKFLLDQGASSTVMGGFYGSALHAAAAKGTVDTFKMLLPESNEGKKTAILAPSGDSWLPLMTTASRGSLEMVELLLDNGADANAGLVDGTTALHLATLKDRTEVAKLLIRQGAPVDQVSQPYGSAFEIASRRANEELALSLLYHRAAAFRRDKQQKTPLHHVANAPQCLPRLATAIIDQYSTAEIDAKDIDGCTALHHASIKGHTPIVSRLLAKGADVAVPDNWNAHALFRAAGCHHKDIVALLLQAGALVDARDAFDRTALHGPSEDENDASIQALLVAAGADVNVRDKYHRTPLHEACNMGRAANVALLLERGARVNVVDNNQRTPLHNALASTDGHRVGTACPRALDLLLARPDLDANLCHGAALQAAAAGGDVDVVRRLLDHGADPAAEGGEYGGALQAAVRGGSVAVLQLLLQSGRRANANRQGGEYGTPLQAAAALGRVEMVRMLLAHGAEDAEEGSGAAGKYGSAMNAVAHELKGGLQGKQNWVMIQRMLAELAGGRRPGPPLDAEHAQDRWELLPSGWDWLPPGEL